MKFASEPKAILLARVAVAKLIFARKCIFSPSHLLFFTGGQTPPLLSTGNASSLQVIYFSLREGRPLPYNPQATHLLSKPSTFLYGRADPSPTSRGNVFFSPRPTRFNFALCILNFAFAKPTIFTQSVSDTKKADLCGLLFALKYRIACLFVCFEKLVAKSNYFVC